MSNIFNEDFLEYVNLLNQYQVEYIIVGGLAVNLHGYQRTTGNMDVFINPIIENHKKLKKVHLDYGMPMGSMEILSDFLNPAKYDVHTFGGGYYKIDILTKCKGIEFESAYINSNKHIIENVEIKFLDLQHLIASKKASKRSRDLSDIDELLKLNSEEE